MLGEVNVAEVIYDLLFHALHGDLVAVDEDGAGHSVIPCFQFILRCV